MRQRIHFSIGKWFKRYLFLIYFESCFQLCAMMPLPEFSALSATFDKAAYIGWILQLFFIYST